jgi:uncharacterized damage-inducible protein DinB
MTTLAQTPYRTLLDEALESWSYTRAGVIAEAQSISTDAWNFRPAEGARTVTELVLHIVESGLMAFGELSNPDGDFTRQPYPAIVQEHAGHVANERDPARLLSLLRETFDEGEARLRAAGELMMLQAIRRFDGLPGTRLAWLWHAIDHESYHRGQLAMYVRIKGGVPALTRLIYGDG